MSESPADTGWEADLAAFANAMDAAGLRCDEGIHADGQLHRYKAPDDSKPDAWYVLHLDGVAAGAFGHWARHPEPIKWSTQQSKPIDREQSNNLKQQIEAAKGERAAELAATQAATANFAREKWLKLKNADPDHPYLVRKQIGTHGAKETADGRLVVPVCVDNQIVSLQFISADGAKLFLKDSKTAGGYYKLGGDPVGVAYIAEGFASGATVREVPNANATVYVAFSCGNLPAVARYVRNAYPDIAIIIVADNDLETIEPPNPGVAWARKAGAAVNGTVIIPTLSATPERKCDINDVLVIEGIEAVRRLLTAAEESATAHPETPADLVAKAREIVRIEKIGDDVTAAFAAPVIAAAAILHEYEGITYARLRRHLKEHGAHMKDWDQRVRKALPNERATHRVSRSSNGAGRSARVPPPGDRGDLPEIDVHERWLRDISADSLDALRAANKIEIQFWVRGGVLTRTHTDDNGAAQVEALDPDALLGALSRSANYYDIILDSYGQPYKRPVDSNKQVARDILKLPRYEEFPRLRGIERQPFFTRDGELVVEPGYHAGAEILLHLPPGFKLSPISQRPSADEVVRARQLLREIIIDFPFVGPADATHVIATMLYPPLREYIDAPPPGLAIDAAAPGSGKGLLAQAIVYLHTGLHTPPFAPTGDAAESRKRITSMHLAGMAQCVLDNVKGKLNDTALMVNLTAPVWSDRVLGSSRMMELPNRLQWFVTGNNIKLVDEMGRRFVRSRLEAAIERPEARSGFKHDPLIDWIKENRATLVWAALTLIQHWFVIGAPEFTERRLGSFERWVRVIGGVLTTAGIEGFLADRDQVSLETDPTYHHGATSYLPGKDFMATPRCERRPWSLSSRSRSWARPKRIVPRRPGSPTSWTRNAAR